MIPKIKMLIVDVDGTLTDGGVYVDEDGMISSFLLKSDADKFAESVNSEVLDFETLSKKYSWVNLPLLKPEKNQ